MRRFSFLTVLAVAALLGGCGGGNQGGEATVWVTRDRGRTLVTSETVPAGLTALQGLDRTASVKTAYGGGFVKAIEGIAGSRTAQSDWFFYVNGYEADRGAAAYRLRSGDLEWWDYRSWRAQERVPIVVGAFPEPFLHGYDGKRRPAAVRYAAGLRRPARLLARLIGARSLAPLAVPATAQANILTIVNGSARFSARFRFASRSRAGDPVVFAVSGAGFARALAVRPGLAARRYEVTS
jgi:hypothetical protein